MKEAPLALRSGQELQSQLQGDAPRLFQHAWADAAEVVLGRMPPISSLKIAYEVEGVNARFNKGGVIVEIGAGVDRPFLRRKPRGADGCGIVAIHRIAGVQCRDGDDIGGAADHVEVDLPAGQTGAPPPDIIARAVQTVGFTHAGSKAFLPVKENQFDLTGSCRGCWEHAGELRQNGCAAGAVIGSGEVGNTAFCVNMAGEEQGACVRFLSEKGVEIRHFPSCGRCKNPALRPPAGRAQPLLKKLKLELVGGTAGRSWA